MTAQAVRVAETATAGETEESPSAQTGLPSSPSPSERLLSLDTFRGFTMFWIVGGGMLAEGIYALSSNPLTAALVRQLHHSPWFGLRFYDCIWPSFMLMVGVSIPFAIAARSRTESESRQLVHAIRRAAVIFLLGSIRESISLNSPYLVELSSALQPIAIAYLISFLAARRSWRFQAGLAAGILTAYACLIAFVPAPGVPAGSYAFNHNLVHSVDMAVLSAHHWDIWPYRDEGWGTVLVIIPSIATTLFGLLIGKLLMTSRTMTAKAGVIGAMGIGLLTLGFGLSHWIPIEMKMWTTSYGLASAGVACLEFLFFFWLVDMVRLRKWTVLLVPFGRNALFIYMLTSLISIKAGTDVFTQPIAEHLGRGADLIEAVGALAVEWLILHWMMKRRIYVRP
jgi:predicted acyltransferase